jgi:lipid II:glycine glycyltransferase (peptidoglycan interpeptide bridge formation enzyme)
VRVREAGESDFEAFYALYGETGARDGFIIRPYEYYATTWRTFLRAQAQEGNPAGGVLLLAEHPEEAQPLAGLFLFRYGARAWYFYGASSERHRRDMPNYLLQWEALRWALGQGCTVYDWWGAPTHPEDEQDPMQGVWQFKQGFGAELQPHIGAWDFPLMPPLYRLYQEAMPAVLDWMRSHHH